MISKQVCLGSISMVLAVLLEAVRRKRAKFPHFAVDLEN
jgi:hypothetical protein